MKKNNLALPCCKEKQFALLSGTISKHRSMSDYFRKINGNEKKIKSKTHFIFLIISINFILLLGNDVNPYEFLDD